MSDSANIVQDSPMEDVATPSPAAAAAATTVAAASASTKSDTPPLPDQSAFVSPQPVAPQSESANADTSLDARLDELLRRTAEFSSFVHSDAKSAS
jgi:hypothetical protein